MKTSNSIRNSFFSLVSNIATIVIGLIAQAIFIKILGAEYLGLNGLFSNIISMLGIVELGIGTAIVYNLYKPLHENNEKEIKSLMNFYKKAYNIISIIVLFIGILITPFLSFFIKEVEVDINIYLVFLLFVLDVFFSYILSYKRSILYASQKNYIINIVHMTYLVGMNLFQLIILYITHNYYLYLIVKIIMRLYENLVISHIVNKMYPYLKDKQINALNKNVRKGIFVKIKALFYHKLGSFIVLGTDNIIISKFLGLEMVGLYSNYYLIINALNTLLGNIITSLTPSVGDLLVENNVEKNYKTFVKIRFANFWIAAFSATCLYVVMEPFIKLWIGNDYLLPNIVLLILVINYYQKLMRLSYSTFKEAAGIFEEDRFVPIIESIINIAVSILLVIKIGLSGVFIGTIISGLVLWLYSYPRFVYKKLFNRSYISYAKETLGYIFVFSVIITITNKINSLFVIEGEFLSVLVSMINSLVISNILLIIFFYKTENFKYYKNIILKILKKNSKKTKASFKLKN